MPSFRPFQKDVISYIAGNPADIFILSPMFREVAVFSFLHSFQRSRSFHKILIFDQLKRREAYPASLLGLNPKKGEVIYRKHHHFKMIYTHQTSPFNQFNQVLKEIGLKGLLNRFVIDGHQKPGARFSQNYLKLSALKRIFGVP